MFNIILSCKMYCLLTQMKLF